MWGKYFRLLYLYLKLPGELNIVENVVVLKISHILHKEKAFLQYF